MAVTAIDVALLLPTEIIDKSLYAKGRRSPASRHSCAPSPRHANALLAESVGAHGYKFDNTHLPHITLVHTYVKTEALGENGPMCGSALCFRACPYVLANVQP